MAAGFADAAGNARTQAIKTIMKKILLALVVPAVLAGCATTPTGPSVLVLPALLVLLLAAATAAAPPAPSSSTRRPRSSSSIAAVL